MTITSLIRNFTSTAVIIDDGYLPVSLDTIQEEHWSDLRSKENQECWRPIREKYFPDINRIVDIKRNDLALEKAWSLYQDDSSNFAVFDPIFSHIFITRDTRIRPLKAMIDYLKNDVGLTLCLHPDIASAVDDIKRSKLVFLDFYLRQTTPEEIIQDVESYADLFLSPVIDGNTQDRRFVFLISTALPSNEEIERFRIKSKMKTAFFKPVQKNDLSKGWLEQELFKKVSRYSDMKRLSDYLDIFSTQISKVADDLRDEIESIELHDLAILNSMRLQKDKENLEKYLSWLLSEALAAKIRASAPLLDAEQKVAQIHEVPFQGTLSPKPVLFDLYSEIAFSIYDSTNQNSKIKFGDVFFHAIVHEEIPPLPADWNFVNEFFQTNAASSLDSGSEATESITLASLSQELLLVISPACDLQRCDINYEVLCVRGRITGQVPTLADLIGQDSLFGIAENPKKRFKHLLQQDIKNKKIYALVEWNPKEITTLRVSDLLNKALYQRRARLNELFGQEVKEEALRQVGRVGVPVDPSFSSALDAKIRLKLALRGQHCELKVPDNFVSGIYLSPNMQNEAKITLSEEFINYLRDSAAKKEGELCPKTYNAIQSFINSGETGFKISKNFEIFSDKGFRVKFANKFDPNTNFDNMIIFYPRGNECDDEEENISKISADVY